MPKLTIRKAEIADADLVVTFIHALAEYEKLQGPDKEAEARLREHGWGDARKFEVSVRVSRVTRSWLWQIPAHRACESSQSEWVRPNGLDGAGLE